MEKYFQKIKKALIFSAHPDDVDFGCAGTAAKLTAFGREVVYCIITDGSKGVQKEEHFGAARKDIVAMREKEQKAAAKTVGVNRVLFLGEIDGELENIPSVRQKIVKIVRQEKPDAVFAFDPACNFENFYRCHRDHRMGGEAVFDAIYPGAGSPAFFPELQKQGIAPHQIKELWFYGTEKPNVYIDISKFMDKKVAALACHESQFTDFKAVKKRVMSRKREGFRRLTFE